jgi:protein-S-isoprenylcysteine O-methyltransferase Ste14
MFRRRDVLGVLCLIPVFALVLLSCPWAEEGTIEDIGLDGLAWAFFVLYVFLRVWATLFAGGRKDRVLQQEGPYSVTRNPLYLGSFCLVLSCGAFLQSFTLLAALAILTGLYSLGVVRAEEQMLSQLFGAEYSNYLRSLHASYLVSPGIAGRGRSKWTCPRSTARPSGLRAPRFCLFSRS